MSLLARFLSPLRRERVADRLLDVGRPTIAELFRDGRVKVTACARHQVATAVRHPGLRPLRRETGVKDVPGPGTPGFRGPPTTRKGHRAGDATQKSPTLLIPWGGDQEGRAITGPGPGELSKTSRWRA